MNNISINIKEKNRAFEKVQNKIEKSLIIGFLSKEANYDLYKKATLDQLKKI